ncbi:MAG: hypothetical protein OXU77_01995 [Gammaproteobacteria bacterium]|nr:hypothetical protein [Gammaproteobacteria bacterium]MDE0443178.1 hypothetical protein [Gammaproteobacteria bacterium]
MLSELEHGLLRGSGNAASGPPIHPSRTARRREIALMATAELAPTTAHSAPGENLDLYGAFADFPG